MNWDLNNKKASRSIPFQNSGSELQNTKNKMSINSARDRQKERARWRETKRKGTKHAAFLASYQMCFPQYVH